MYNVDSVQGEVLSFFLLNLNLNFFLDSNTLLVTHYNTLSRDLPHRT
jgi:hypothetical protein